MLLIKRNKEQGEQGYDYPFSFVTNKGCHLKEKGVMPTYCKGYFGQYFLGDRLFAFVHFWVKLVQGCVHHFHANPHITLQKEKKKRNYMICTKKLGTFLLPLKTELINSHSTAMQYSNDNLKSSDHAQKHSFQPAVKKKTKKTLSNCYQKFCKNEKVYFYAALS